MDEENKKSDLLSRMLKRDLCLFFLLLLCGYNCYCIFPFCSTNVLFVLCYDPRAKNLLASFLPVQAMPDTRSSVAATLCKQALLVLVT